MKREIITNRIVHIEGYLQELDSLFALDKETELLRDSVKMHAVERLLQLFVDAAVDINQNIITSRKLAPADSYKGSFVILGEQSIIPPDFADMISDSVGLRNAIVHRYEFVSNSVIIAGVKKLIPQYRTYLKHIIQFLDAQ